MRLWQQNWRVNWIPGLSIAGFVILARLLGLLQPIEWKAFDTSLRWRPAEATDTRITVIAITEEDIQTTLGHPISDRDLAALVSQLQTYNPRAIGIDIVRDQPVGEGFAELELALTNADNVVGIESIEPPTVSAPPMLNENQIGFVDAIPDSDGSLRRSLLASADKSGRYRFSLTVQLARTYLATDNITLENGIKDAEAMRFGSVEIPHFYPNTGAYINEDNGGNQTLINFRAGSEPFEQVSYTDVMSGKVALEKLADRALLIGYTAKSVKDFENSFAIANINPSAVPGVTIQAHALSQILSAIYDDRPFIRTLLDPLEYLLIVGMGLIGISLAHWQRKPATHLLLVVVICSSWLLLLYTIAIANWWLPLVPTLIAFLVSAVTLYPFYQAQLQLQAQIAERNKLIEQTYTNIHNSSLQEIGLMLRNWAEGEPAAAEMRSQLENVNMELRNIRETLQEEMKLSEEKLIIVKGQPIDLSLPLHAILEETYRNTIERQRDFFLSVATVPRFDPVADGRLSKSEKRAIARFLEEALTNSYKYAAGVTKIELISRRTDDCNIIQVADNGQASTILQEKRYGGDGTRQANRIANQLGGKFTRTSLDPKGVCCELRWPVKLSTWRRWVKAP